MGSRNIPEGIRGVYTRKEFPGMGEREGGKQGVLNKRFPFEALFYFLFFNRQPLHEFHQAGIPGLFVNLVYFKDEVLGFTGGFHPVTGAHMAHLHVFKLLGPFKNFHFYFKIRVFPRIFSDACIEYRYEPIT